METGRARTRCKIRVSVSAVMLAVGFFGSLLTDYGREHASAAVVLVMASGIHEIGHWVLARTVGVPLTELRLDLFGARLRTSGTMTYEQEWWLSAGGPLFNFAGVLILLPLWLSGTGGQTDINPWVLEQVGAFMALSLGLGGLNLLPIETFDGGRMLYCFLALFAEEDVAARIARWVSVICLTALWMLAVYVLLRVGRSLSMMVFSGMLLYRGLLGEQGI